MTGRTSSRLLSGWLAAVLGLGSALAVQAQVGPSRQNVKPAAKRRPARPAAAPVRARAPQRSPRQSPRVGRVRPPRSTGPVVAQPRKPTTRVRPVATRPRTQPPARVSDPDPAEAARRAAREAEIARKQQEAEAARQAAEAEAARLAEQLRVAAAWQADEAAALEQIRGLSAQLPRPNLAGVKAPALPPPPAAPAVNTLYHQKVTLLFRREDGAPFDAAQIRRSSDLLPATASGDRLELDGPRLAGGAELRLEAPADWAWVNPGDARLALGEYPGEESRVELPSGETPAPVAPPASQPLFPSAEAVAAARAALPPVAHARPETGAYPRPAAHLLPALLHLAEVRRTLDRVPPLSAEASLERRKQVWEAGERARRLLDAAALSLKESKETLDGFKLETVREILKQGFRLDYSRLPALYPTLTTRLLQLRAEVAWWQAEALNPAAPDRAAALQLLREAPEGPEVAEQLARYRSAAEGEAEYRRRVQSGALQPRSPRTVRVTRHLTRTLTLRRLSVDLRFAKGDLQADDRVVLGGGQIPFTLEGDFWQARVPLSRLSAGEPLRIARTSGSHELRGELPLPKLDPYAPAGTLLQVPSLQPAALWTVAIDAGKAGKLPVFRPLSGDQVRSLRREGDEVQARDGSRWLALRGMPLAVRLNERAPEGPTIVAVRLEGAQVGEVAGLRVGASARAVEQLAGFPVEPNATLKLKGGTVEMLLEGGTLRRIVIDREMAGR